MDNLKIFEWIYVMQQIIKYKRTLIFFIYQNQHKYTKSSHINDLVYTENVSILNKCIYVIAVSIVKWYHILKHDTGRNKMASFENIRLPILLLYSSLFIRKHIDIFLNVKNRIRILKYFSTFRV